MRYKLICEPVFCLKAMLHPVDFWCKLSKRNMSLKSSLAFDMLILSVNYKPSVCSCYALHTIVYKNLTRANKTLIFYITHHTPVEVLSDQRN